MAWAKRKAMSWEWFEQVASVGNVANTCEQLAAAKHKLMFVVPLPADFHYTPERAVLIISCKGTPIPVEPKVKKAKPDAVTE